MSNYNNGPGAERWCENGSLACVCLSLSHSCRAHSLNNPAAWSSMQAATTLQRTSLFQSGSTHLNKFLTSWSLMQLWRSNLSICCCCYPVISLYMSYPCLISMSRHLIMAEGSEWLSNHPEGSSVLFPPKQTSSQSRKSPMEPDWGSVRVCKPAQNRETAPSRMD